MDRATVASGTLSIALLLVSPMPLAGQRPVERAIVIRGGLMVDGSGGPARRADVRVVGDSIAAVAASLTPNPADYVIESAGKVVAPGFIDPYSHADRGIEDWPEAESQVRQGITLAVVGQDGRSALPIAAFLETVGQVRPAINFATAVGHGSVRAAVLGADYRRPATAGEVATMERLVERGMRDGAVGLSSGLEYDPGFYARVEEVASLAAVAARFGGYYASHVRDEEDGVIGAWQEAIEIGRRAGIHVHISHAKLASRAVWGKAAEALAVLDAAAGQGVQVTADWYPYDFWQSSLYVIVPDRDWSNPSKWVTGLADIGGPGNVMVTSYPPRPQYVGKTIAQIATDAGTDPVELILQMLSEYGPNVGIIATAMDDRDLQRFAVDPRVLVCSDGQLRGRHPRGYGSFPRVLGRYVRERAMLTLPEAIAKMTIRVATLLGFPDRGTLKVGSKADIVVFDPATIQDRGTKATPDQYAVGVEYLIVNGQIVLDAGTMTKARPGRALRRRE